MPKSYAIMPRREKLCQTSKSYATAKKVMPLLKKVMPNCDNANAIADEAFAQARRTLENLYYMDK